MTVISAADQARTTAAPRQELLARFIAILACPHCHAPLACPSMLNDAPLVCSSCGLVGEVRGGQLCFEGLSDQPITGDWLNRLKEVAKRRLGRIYPLAIRAFSPVYYPDVAARFFATFPGEQELLADLGSGTTHHHDRAACIDGYGYANVHFVADLQRLPLLSNSLDGALSVAVLEHVPQPAEHVREMWRVLRPGGRVSCFIPFIQGYHASPHDYQRYTIAGIRELFSSAGFEVLEVRVGAGPTSGLLWILQEWLALVLSLGSARLYRLIMPLTWILSPLKYFDLILARHPSAAVIASGFQIEARKPAVQPADHSPPQARHAD